MSAYAFIRLIILTTKTAIQFMKGKVKCMKKNKRLLAVLTSIAAAFSLFVMFVPEAMSADNSTSLICLSGDEPVSGMKWKIYHIGEIRDNECVLTGAYEDYAVDLTNLTSENINGTAKALESFVLGNNLPYLAEGSTDENGTASFSSLDPGLYLAVSQNVKIEHEAYVACPLLFEVKGGNSGESTIFPKMYSTNTLAGYEEYYTLKKIWVDNDNNAQMRPEYVTVDLFKNGEISDTITLSEDNGWEYRWENLDPADEWRVVERNIPQKYEVIVDYNSSQYLIKNTYNPSRKTTGGYETNTASATTTISTTTVTTTATATTTLPPASTTVTEPKLPQTGQLWWPIVPLTTGGFVLLFTGLAMNKRKDDEE